MIFTWYSRQNQHNYGKSPGKSPKYLFQTWNHSRFQLNPAKLLASSLRNWCCSQWSPPEYPRQPRLASLSLGNVGRYRAPGRTTVVHPQGYGPCWVQKQHMKPYENHPVFTTCVSFLVVCCKKKNKWNMLEEQPPVKQQKRDSESI